MRHIILCLLVLLLSSTLAYGDSISCQFQMRDGRIRKGKVFYPEKFNKKALVIIVNHRQQKVEEAQFLYSYLVDKLLADGISCCFFDNRPLHSEDSTSLTTLFDMADDASDVYNSLKKNKTFKKFKMGFIGTSESGGSALISASSVAKPSFLIQLVTNVEPQDKKDHQIFTLYNNPVWTAAFTDISTALSLPFFKQSVSYFPNASMGISFHEYSAMYQIMIDDMKHSRIGDKEDYAKRLYNKYEGSIKSHRELFAPLITHFLGKQMEEDYLAPRMWYNAKPYYKKVKCPILFLSGYHDYNVLCSTNIVEFEKTMHENGNKNYTSVIVDATHNLMDFGVERRIMHGGDGEIDRSKQHQIMDAISEWLRRNVN